MTRLHEDLLACYRAALEAVDPAEAVRRVLRRQGTTLEAAGQRYALAGKGIRILAFGKGAGPMVLAAKEIFEGLPVDGVAIVPDGGAVPTRFVEVREAAHPIPDRRGVEGANRVAALAREATEDDLILCLISGGGSALLADPAPPVSLEEIQRLTQRLLRCGVPIQDLNAVRKHLAFLKGGQLARLAAPAPVLSLILSDVVGDDLGTIASGPTAPDPTTFADAVAVLEACGLWEKATPAVRARLEAGLDGAIPDTPKPGDPLFERVQNVLIGSARVAAEAAAQEARRRGYTPLILTTTLTGEAREVARACAAVVREVVRHGRPVPPPALLIWAGETTVTVRGSGKGGRNQELALAAALELEGLGERVALASLGTDGIDGPTDAAGGIVDGTTAERARRAGVDLRAALAANDSYTALGALGARVHVGPTGTNVGDLILAAVLPEG